MLSPLFASPALPMDRVWTLKLLCEAFEALERAKTCDNLRVEMKRFAQLMEFDHFAYALTINAPSLKQQHYLLNGFPLEWCERYVNGDYFKVDPVVRHALTTSLPAIWTEDMFHDGQHEQFWEEARAFGLSSGLSFAVRDQPGVTGIFSIARDKPLDLEAVDMVALIGRAPDVCMHAAPCGGPTGAAKTAAGAECHSDLARARMHAMVCRWEDCLGNRPYPEHCGTNRCVPRKQRDQKTWRSKQDAGHCPRDCLEAAIST